MTGCLITYYTSTHFKSHFRVFDEYEIHKLSVVWVILTHLSILSHLASDDASALRVLHRAAALHSLLHHRLLVVAGGSALGGAARDASAAARALSSVGTSSRGHFEPFYIYFVRKNVRRKYKNAMGAKEDKGQAQTSLFFPEFVLGSSF